MALTVVFFVLMLCGANICDWDTRRLGYDAMAPCQAERIAFFVIALLVFIIAAITDKIDGHLARKHDQVTDLGKFLDPLADKMLVNTAFLMLSMVGAVPVWVFIIILWRDLAVDGARMMMAQKGTTLAASLWGKIKTLAQMIVLPLIILNLIIQSDVLGMISNVLLYIVLILTIISGGEILIKGLKLLKKEQQDSGSEND